MRDETSMQVEGPLKSLLKERGLHKKDITIIQEDNRIEIYTKDGDVYQYFVGSDGNYILNKVK